MVKSHIDAGTNPLKVGENSDRLMLVFTRANQIGIGYCADRLRQKEILSKRVAKAGAFMESNRLLQEKKS
jgi:hypothetical protein